MTKAEAHKILDAARGGYPTSTQMIDEALSVTGDIGNEAPVQIWRGADDWMRTDLGTLGPAGVFDGLLQ